MSGCGCEMTARNDAERKTLWMVLSINALMFVIEFGFGLWAQSTGLIADSLDMLADGFFHELGTIPRPHQGLHGFPDRRIQTDGCLLSHTTKVFHSSS